MANNCTANLDSIEKFCGANPDGIKTRIWVQAKEDISEIAEAQDGKVDSITGDFYVWPISPLEGNYEGTPEGDVDNTTQQHVLNCFIPQMKGEKSHILNSSIGGEFIVVYTDRNGRKWIIGDLDEGATIRVTSGTAKNGYTLEITWPANTLLREFTGTITEIENSPS